MLSFLVYLFIFFYFCFALFYFGFAGEGWRSLCASLQKHYVLPLHNGGRKKKNEGGKDRRRKFVGYGVLFSGELPAGFLALRAKCEYRI